MSLVCLSTPSFAHSGTVQVEVESFKFNNRCAIHKPQSFKFQSLQFQSQSQILRV
jgi:hypothetical protein